MDALARVRCARQAAAALAALLAGACAGLLPATPPPAGTAERRVFQILEGRGLALEIPAGWRVQVYAPERGSFAGVRLDAPGGGALLVAAVYEPGPPAGAPGLEVARALAEAALAEDAPRAAGPEPILRELAGRGGAPCGYWFVLADRTYAPPGPGEERWRNLLRGVRAAGDLVVGFTWLDDWPGPDREQALAVLAGAEQVGGPLSGAGEPR